MPLRRGANAFRRSPCIDASRVHFFLRRMSTDPIGAATRGSHGLDDTGDIDGCSAGASGTAPSRVDSKQLELEFASKLAALDELARQIPVPPAGAGAPSASSSPAGNGGSAGV